MLTTDSAHFISCFKKKKKKSSVKTNSSYFKPKLMNQLYYFKRETGKGNTRERKDAGVFGRIGGL